MDEPVVAKAVCLHCNGVVDAGDRFCRCCGASVLNRVESAPSVPQSDLWDSLWTVLAMLFLVAGPFAIPLLWRSRRFSRVWKNILTALVFGEALLLLLVVWLVVQHVFGPVVEALGEVLGS